MRNQEDILQELRSVSPLIASLEKAPLWKVPEGYFESLPQILTESVIKTLGVRSQPEPTTGAGPRVPEGYFEHLSESILNRIREMESTEAASGDAAFHELPEILLQSKGQTPFLVPEGYFAGLSERVMSKIGTLAEGQESVESEIELPEWLEKLRFHKVFSVPEGYFSQLGEELTAAVLGSQEGNAEPAELPEQISPVLAGIRNLQVFAVPDGYFAQLPQSLLKAVSNSGAAPVVQLPRKGNWIRYAVAAAVTGILTFTSLQYFKTRNQGEPPADNTASTDKFPDYIKESLQYKTAADLDAGLEQLSDAEIIKYLDRNGNIMDNELLMSNTDDSTLPSQNDYLNDSTTLNNYLDKIYKDRIQNATP